MHKCRNQYGKVSYRFGLVTVPVALYPATEAHPGPELHLYHASDKSRIRLRRVCETEGTEVPQAEIARGREGPAGEPVLLTAEDFAELPVPSKRVIEVLAFIDEHEVDPLRLSVPYYVGLSTGHLPAKPYVLLRDALAHSGKVREDLLVLMEMLSSDFDLAALRDEYNAALEQMVARKLELVEPVGTERAAAISGGTVVDLLEALQRSIDRAQQEHGGTAAKPSKKASAKKAAAKKAPRKRPPAAS